MNRAMVVHRYDDDSFVVFRSRDHIIPFFEYLNSKYPHVKFTHKYRVF